MELQPWRNLIVEKVSHSMKTTGILTRVESFKDGVFGELRIAGLTLMTMEDDWKNNQAKISCIPNGTYTCKRTIYHKHNYETFEITDVPKRVRILIHPANTEEDVEGCIGVGLRYGSLRVQDEDSPLKLKPWVDKRSVVDSKEAFRLLMERLALFDEFTLVIEWAPNLGVT